MHDPGFNERWTQHPEPQASLGGFWSKTGWTPETFKGKRVLDAGCGCGRYSKLALDCGAAEVVAVDSSPAALEACAKNALGVVTREADLLDDLIDQQIGDFDLVFSMGVLHHTESTERAFNELATKVRPGGQLAVWVYARPVADARDLLRVEMLHEITKACPPHRLHAICERWAVRIRDMDNDERGPLQQVLQVSTSPDDEECVSDTFDWHTPQYRWWHTPQQLRTWFDAAGFYDLQENEFPVSMTGVKA